MDDTNNDAALALVPNRIAALAMMPDANVHRDDVTVLRLRAMAEGITLLTNELSVLVSKNITMARTKQLKELEDCILALGEEVIGYNSVRTQQPNRQQRRANMSKKKH